MITRLIGGLVTDVLLLPVTVPLIILDWLQPIEDTASFPALLVLPDFPNVRVRG